MTLLYQTLKSTLGLDTIIEHTWGTAADSNIAFKIAARQLQVKTWFFLTAYRMSSSFYCHR